MGVLLEFVTCFSYAMLSQFQFYQHARQEILLTIFCVSVAICLNLARIDISEGILPSWLSRFLSLGHRGYVCPYCGGTRAFVYALGADFAKALHCSLLGMLVAPWLLATFPFRLWFFLCPGSPKAQLFFSSLKRVERARHFLIVTAILFALQLSLHCSGKLSWLPLEQFLKQ